jgi:uncharacterized phage protein gp47/JayE
MPIRNLTTIIQDAITFITGKRPNTATFTGTVTRDVVIEAPAQEFDRIYQELSHTQKLQTVQFPDELSEDELDALAENYAMTRLGGTTASGTVTFQIRNFNTGSSNVTVPTGTVVSTQGTDTVPQVSFVTTQTLLFQASLAPSLFNPTTGLYEKIASIVAQDIGTISNVAAGTIVNLVSSVPGIDSVTNNVATTGGVDTENNTAFAERIKTKLSGNSIGTSGGILNLVRENANVSDAIVVTPNDPEMLRDEFGGEVDVYVLGEVLDQISDIVLYTTAGSQEFILQHQPARSISSVTGIALSVPVPFIEGIDFSFIEDPSLLVNGSTRLQNKIVFNIGGTNPDDATNVTISYVYNSLIETLQIELDRDDNHIVTADILVKEPQEATINIEAEVTLFPGFASATEIANIQTALSESINTLGLGDDIDRSDVIGLIEGVESVDQVNVNTLVLEKNGDPLPLATQRLEIFKTEYPRIGTIIVTTI